MAADIAYRLEDHIPVGDNLGVVHSLVVVRTLVVRNPEVGNLVVVRSYV